MSFKNEGVRSFSDIAVPSFSILGAKVQGLFQMSIILGDHNCHMLLTRIIKTRTAHPSGTARGSAMGLTDSQKTPKTM